MIDGGIAISQAMKRFALEIEDAPADKVSVVLYGMEYRWLSDDSIATARRDLRAELKLPAEAQLLGMACRPGGAKRDSLRAGRLCAASVLISRAPAW